ncbi:Hypothetical protein CINCED_3A005122 [Cinara cedri]|uniref:Transcription cofactor vestigial-like protein 4 n=1 Tax=Cinara cedri TaxID=506608 RepID=A0A5E4LY17_9HEMI|nr:Hypothetical protein CINCED_3A005122 [Cinara cedri]
MSLCVMFSRFEQQQQQQQQHHHHRRHHHHHPHHHHHLHRDGRNNKADRSRHLWQPWVERAGNFDDRSRSLSLRCSAMEGTVGTVGKWKRERRHRAVCTSPVSPPPSYLRNSQEPLDMTTTASSAASRALLPKERASVIMAAAAAASSPSSVTAATGHRTSASGGISDPVIDEHFRRSLGKDYMNVFAPAVIARRDQTPAADPIDVAGGSGDDNDVDDDDDDDDVGLSVDDHFAKALGDTWVKLQKEEYQKKRKESTTTGGDGGGRQKVNVYAA